MLATQDSNKLAVTKEEAAKLLSIGVTVLDRLAKAGKIKPFRIGKRGVRYPVSGAATLRANCNPRKPS